MSAFLKADKMKRKLHKERNQLVGRRNLGSLEKKQDYRKRARHHHAKRDTLKALYKRALSKNPDEFYFNMINSQTKDGVHYSKTKEETITPEQEMLMRSQDLNYINMKRGAEAKKIERLKSELHLISVDHKLQNKHTFFVDSKKEVKEFDVAKRLNTHPELLSRSYNIPSKEMLQDEQFRLSLQQQLQRGRTREDTDGDVIKQMETSNKCGKKSYKELCQRIQRHKQLTITSEKLQVKKHLINKSSKRKEVVSESKSNAPVYKWHMERKR